MSSVTEADPAKLVVSVISADRELIAQAIKDLSGQFGRPDFISGHLPFEYTSYYEAEMGPGLVRRLVSFEELIRPEALPKIKGTANRIESVYAENGRRKVNIDPGYLNRCQLVLATGKPYAHRPYLREGVYADLTLVFRGGSFQPLEWTYPDYAGLEIRCLLSQIRDKYLLQLRAKNQKGFQ